jgi:hypothetical protein
MVVVAGDGRILPRHLVDRPLPQVAGEGQHVGLVDQRQMVAGAIGGQSEGEAGAPLDAVPGVHRSLGGHLEGVPSPQEPTLTGVGPLGVLADDHEVAVGCRGTGHTGERSHVHVKVQFEAETEQEAPLQWPRRNGGGSHRWAHRAQTGWRPGGAAPRAPGRAGPRRCGRSGRHPRSYSVQWRETPAASPPP